jgi:uncharacterized protein YacL
MIPSLTINLLRALFVIFAAFMGFSIGDAIGYPVDGVLGGLAFGLVIVLADRLIKGVTLRLFSAATFGLFIGSVLSKLLLDSGVLKYLDADTQWMISLVTYAVFSYIGMMLAIRSNRDEFAMIIPYVRFRESSVQDSPLIVDTNVVIDGRIVEICNAGFLSGSLVVPRFVLDELQTLGNSSDPVTRHSGRRGFDTLAQMQANPKMSLTIHEGALEQATHDVRLIHLANLLRARIATTDSTLCQLAKLQGIQTLNILDLARAVRPSIATGDQIELALVKEGKDPHQAVGFLSDGTMIVVNHAVNSIGQTVKVVITSSIQTAAGRMYFAELR